MSMKNPLTPTGIELATFRFVAQHLNHCATAVPCTISTLTPAGIEPATFRFVAQHLNHCATALLLYTWPKFWENRIFFTTNLLFCDNSCAHVLQRRTISSLYEGCWISAVNLLPFASVMDCTKCYVLMISVCVIFKGRESLGRKTNVLVSIQLNL